MPGLLRGVARTAIIAGTASSVSGRVHRRQAERFAERDAQIAARRRAAFQHQEQEEYAGRSPAAPAEAMDVGMQAKMAMLKELAELRTQGVLTEEEFASEKAKILG